MQWWYKYEFMRYFCWQRPSVRDRWCLIWHCFFRPDLGYPFLAKNLHTQMLHFVKTDFQCKFSTSRLIWICLIFSLIKNNSLETYFLLKLFFNNSNFETLYFLKSSPIFDKLSFTVQNTMVSFEYVDIWQKNVVS